MYYQTKGLQPEFWICYSPADGASFGIFSFEKFHQQVIKTFFTKNAKYMNSYEIADFDESSADFR
jgi:hypothetical protein